MKFGRKIAAYSLTVSALIMGITSIASAHVVVKPGEVLTGSFQTFTVGVPVEKNIATTAITLEVPTGLGHVMPTVKPGWTIRVEKEGTGEDMAVKSITWSEGEIGAGFRDDFTFSAKSPDKPVELRWKAYQTYADGSVVAWDLPEDKQPKKADGSPDFSKSGPFSVTKVTNGSAQEQARPQSHDNAHDAQNTANRALYVGIGGVLLGLAAIYLVTRK